LRRLAGACKHWRPFPLNHLKSALQAPEASLKTTLRNFALSLFCICSMPWLCSCSAAYESEPLVEYSTDVVVTDTRPRSLTRELEPGVFLVEIRERDVDLRVSLDVGSRHVDLADAYLRHGVHRSVVRLGEASRLRLTFDSADARGWKGSAAVRILRWPVSAPGAPPDDGLLGLEALGRGGELIAQGKPEAWRAALTAFEAAAQHFRSARDLHLLAETEYQRAQLELNFLSDAMASRRNAESALANFGAAGDGTGVQRAALLLAQGDFELASRLGPEVARADQRALLDDAALRAGGAQEFFEKHDLQSDALAALDVACTRERLLGRDEQDTLAFESMRNRARAREDNHFGIVATQRLAQIARRRGDVQRAVALYEDLRPLLDRSRDPGLQAAVGSALGDALLERGEFDRALLLHVDALEIWNERGDGRQVARELAALAAVQLKTGSPDRALAALEGALSLGERAHDRDGHVVTLQLAATAAGQLGRHEVAIEYLRDAERLDAHGVALERTRLLQAGELRMTGALDAAERALQRPLAAGDASVRAGALLERARLRQAQRRYVEALADLGTADAIQQRLGLNFDRIETSSARALALLDAGDVAGASGAADTAVMLESRIRVNSASPEIRARFLAANYAPYEARIEVQLAGDDPAASWRAFRSADAIRARGLTDRLARGARGARPAPDGEVDRLHAALSRLQGDYERRVRRGIAGTVAALEAKQRIETLHWQREARLLSQEGVEPAEANALPESIEDARLGIPADTAVLAYFVGDRRTHAWLLTRQELRHAVLPGRRALERLTTEFIERQRQDADPVADTTRLLGPLLNDVSARRLVVLADGPLNGLPFAALPMPHGKPRELLIDRFVITAAPSLALAMRPASAAPAAGRRVAVISDPVYTADDRRLSTATNRASQFRGVDSDADRLARLPYSAIEARAVARAFDGARIIELTGFDATARHVIDLPSQELDVLHFATHAVVRRDAPEQSALFLSEYAADGSSLPSDRLTAEDIRRAGLRAGVVVLSGCATGDGHELRGEGVLGLAYGFLSNGTDTVVASLWPVEDALTARFMQEFYAAYRAGGSASEALRSAQLRTRNSGSSPVWASFVVRSSSLH
jgi:CHAT domain-containing protein